MKRLKYLLLTVTVVAVGATFSAKAGEVFYSPKAKQLSDSLRTVPTAPYEVDLVAYRANGNARAWELQQSVRTVPGMGNDIDFAADATRPTLQPKDPNYDAMWRENAEGEFGTVPVS